MYNDQYFSNFLTALKPGNISTDANQKKAQNLKVNDNDGSGEQSHPARSKFVLSVCRTVYQPF